ncbi:L-glutamine ABC transporter membrane protein /L-glutamate ABC transporter membrane protein /L-aspartate ABC transporter membrane protein /L-asparagine ABC transporter membrane protein [Octadecabacter temperatus]|uniref:Putative glutamine ABC transporter permease protein GlnM n=1 Tax=Octadecabacter temperatus TaxID=1458307 RepID=A0A0K0Y1W6_9RHOB|nr:ABC transporter permease subunit [Octadecabacter temperatus]AKS44881.1 putative glutamine ABC transporter permease protein GlnM [Octadecabacter temperatus]SIO34130.1 L-glutamine ABC transporter membrane protein /L-glutamate ABC transporter membrane protein /L-aspartate ABC transporter membrane protein /L-asparagine ABC transporter membrane protein [Octadecabacter temperatus]
MTTLTDPPKASFRLSQLIYDTRYRSITIQVIAMILVVLGLYWLVNNTIQNLSALGKDFNFGFLTQPAGYDINQRLIEYTSQSTHFRAAIVGILNTLLVAFLGCILATIIGVFVGVLRLSKNWVVSRLMSVYVEGFRNVPLLLWIIAIFAIMTESMPQPRDFKVGGDAAMILGDSVAVTNRGVYVPGVVFENGLLGAPLLNWLLVAAVLIASLFVIRIVRRRADATQESTGIRPTTWYQQLALLIVPTGALLFLMGAHLQIPYIKGFNFTDGVHLRNSLIALWIALSLYTGAFIAEIVRSGILAISKGQSEAAAALGLRPSRTMNLVILPQAMRVIIPPLISQYLNLTKNSSLAIAVGYMDVRATLGGITINQTGRELEGILLMAAFYLLLSLTISGVMNVYNNRTQLQER